MARLLLSLLGYRFDLELCREADLPDPEPEPEQPDDPGSCTTYPLGFQSPGRPPYEIYFPDRA